MTASGDKFWRVRNSWGEYWGDMGFVNVDRGNNALCLESQGSWGVPATWTEHNYGCSEDGSNCSPRSGHWVDPAHNNGVLSMRLA